MFACTEVSEVVRIRGQTLLSVVWIGGSRVGPGMTEIRPGMTGGSLGSIFSHGYSKRLTRLGLRGAALAPDAPGVMSVCPVGAHSLLRVDDSRYFARLFCRFLLSFIAVMLVD